MSNKKDEAQLKLHFVNISKTRPRALRGQTVHWIGAQFSPCMSLETREVFKHVKIICRNNKRKQKNKGEDQRERHCCGIQSA